MKAVTQFPLLVVDRFESHGLFSQDFREVEQVATPLNLTVMTHLPDRNSWFVVHLGKFGRIRAGRSAINAPRRLSPQRFMAAFPVIFLLKRIIFALLLAE